MLLILSVNTDELFFIKKLKKKKITNDYKIFLKETNLKLKKQNMHR